MRIRLDLDPSRLLNWHLWTAQSLTAAGHEVICRMAGSGRPLPVACRLLVDLERTVYGHRFGDSVAAAGDALRAMARDCDGAIDLTIDFAAGVDSVPEGRVIVPSFDGIPGEIGIFSAFVDGRELSIELHDGARPSRPWRARPASADRGIVTACLDGVLSAAVALIVKAAAGPTDAPGPPAPNPPVHDPHAHDDRAAPQADARPALRTPPFAVPEVAVARAAVTVAGKVAKALYRLAAGGNVWTVGWRIAGPDSLFAQGQTSFRVLSGGSDGYLADPFPIRHRGRDYVFVELFPYATGKGCIAVVEVTGDGAVGEPRIVLDEPHHLSYPFVFENEGEVWMIPEAGASRAVDLYRAVEFPWRWERAARLAEGFEAYDTTPLVVGRDVWFFSALRSWQSTTSDILGLHRAEGLRGRWIPHAANPVVIDAALGRPAGAFLRAGGRVFRPVQDCRAYYGSGLTLCRIETLNGTAFAQTPVGRIDVGDYGCHTYNRAPGLEVIDLWGTPARSVAARYRRLAVDAVAGPATQHHAKPGPVLSFAQHVVPVFGDGRQQVANDPT